MTKNSTVLQRVSEKIIFDENTTCWTWTGSKTRGGYGKFNLYGKFFRSHRLTYQLFRGYIPDNLTLDHLCRNRICVNPEHLEPVTIKENILRGEAPSAQNSRKTHCPRGHPLSGDNLLSNDYRRCRICRKLDWKRANATRLK